MAYIVDHISMLLNSMETFPGLLHRIWCVCVYVYVYVYVSTHVSRVEFKGSVLFNDLFL